MSFLKRLKDKFSTKSTEDIERELTEDEELDQPSARGNEQENEELAPKKKKPRKLSEADFDEGGLISIEDFERIEVQKMGAEFKAGLGKSRGGSQEQLNNLIARCRTVDEDFFEALEEMLVAADAGFNMVMQLMDELRTEAQRRNIKETEGLREIIVERIVETYHQEGNHSEAMNIGDGRLNVISMAGANGVSKATTIGKPVHRYGMKDKRVILAAGDTFRVSAIEQLQVWGDRVGVEVIRQSEGSDPIVVVYDAINAAKNKGVNILTYDTVGRLQNKSNLMQELDKMKRVISCAVLDALHEALLCLGATIGQSALSQTRLLKEVTNVSGIALTKLDGTAKSGIVLAIRNELHISVKYVGLGEKLDDLQPFNSESYVYGPFANMIEQNDNISDEMQSLANNNEEHQNGEK